MLRSLVGSEMCIRDRHISASIPYSLIIYVFLIGFWFVFFCVNFEIGILTVSNWLYYLLNLMMDYNNNEQIIISTYSWSLIRLRVILKNSITLIVTFQAKISTQTFSPGKIPGFPGIFPGDNSPGISPGKNYKRKFTGDSPGLTGKYYRDSPGCLPGFTGIHRDAYRDFPGFSLEFTRDSLLWLDRAKNFVFKLLSQV